MVQYENMNIYGNPAIEAVINCRWPAARNFFLFLFLRFLILCVCFIVVSVAYLHDSNISANGLVASIVIFYFMAIYLFATEVIQLYYEGPRRYFGDVFNTFDMLSIMPSIISNVNYKKFRFSAGGFENAGTADTGFVVVISVCIFLLWIELVGLVQFSQLILLRENIFKVINFFP
jgi:hypothetical protein